MHVNQTLLDDYLASVEVINCRRVHFVVANKLKPMMMVRDSVVKTAKERERKDTRSIHLVEVLNREKIFKSSSFRF